MAYELEHIPASAAMHAGVARMDITPPVGMYNRIWGAASHDRAEGVHRPLTLTALAMLDRPNSIPLLLVSLDWCLISLGPTLERLRKPLLPQVGDDVARIMLCCTHTHGLGFINDDRATLDGGDLIEPYLAHVIEALEAAAKQAIAQARHTPALLTWAAGQCDLASNRDLREPGRDRIVCGWNPAAEADTTLMVGRLTRKDNGAPLATLVNYACHPTTLAWENRNFSPDFIGTMREIVEAQTQGAPALFLQGASGELAPRYQYVGDAAVPDQHGRQLGFAVLSTLAGMLPPGQKLCYQGVKESGAPLAVWRPEPFEASATLEASLVPVELPKKASLPTVQQLDEELRACEDRALAERLRRKRTLLQRLGPGPRATIGLWVWRLGGTLIFAQPNEAYSQFQIDLRKAFADYAVVVTNVTNGSVGYLSPAALYDEASLYQIWQSPFERGALEALTTCAIEAGKTIVQAERQAAAM